MVEKARKRIHICATPSATCNHLIVLHGHIVLSIMESRVWLNDQSERQLALFQERVRRRHSIKRRSHVLGGAIGVRRRSNRRLYARLALSVCHLGIEPGLTFGGRMIGGGAWSKSLTWKGWPCMLISTGCRGFNRICTPCGC